MSLPSTIEIPTFCLWVSRDLSESRDGVLGVFGNTWGLLLGFGGGGCRCRPLFESSHLRGRE